MRKKPGRPTAQLWVVSKVDAGASLVDFLFARLTAIGPPASVSRSYARRIIVAGGTRIDGTTARRPGRLLDAGMQVRASFEMPPPSTGDSAHGGLIRILFDDDILLAVEKPRGIPTVPTADPRRPSLVSLLEAQLGSLGRPRRLAVHQRLDAETSGIVLFATNDRANASLAEQIARHSVVKRYLALVARPARSVPATFTINLPLGQAGNGPAGRMGVRDDGQEAATAVRVLERFRDALLVEARPATGRKHQIRVHLAAWGMPILGDPLHGSVATKRRAPSLMLHAAGLELVHPITGTDLRLTSEAPGDFEARVLLERARSRRRL